MALRSGFRLTDMVNKLGLGLCQKHGVINGKEIRAITCLSSLYTVPTYREMVIPRFSLLGYILGRGLNSSGGGKSSTGWN